MSRYNMHFELFSVLCYIQKIKVPCLAYLAYFLYYLCRVVEPHSRISCDVSASIVRVPLECPAEGTVHSELCGATLNSESKRDELSEIKVQKTGSVILMCTVILSCLVTVFTLDFLVILSSQFVLNTQK